jgi:hypothetical protein
MAHAEAKSAAKFIVELVDDKDAFLLWKAYLKRIRPVPVDVLQKVSSEMALAMAKAGAGAVLRPDIVGLAMDTVGEMIWKQLDEQGHYEWLLKVK